jgi:hypothetical protein
MAPIRRKAALALTLALAATLLAGCAGSTSSTLVPKGVLPAAGEPVMYEFYTDT